MSEFEKEVLNLLRGIDEKLNTLLNNSKIRAISNETTTVSEDRYVKPSEIVERQEEVEKSKEKPLVEGRRVCPACGGTSFNTEEDKTQVLFQQAGIKIHAKKYICRNCGTEA